MSCTQFNSVKPLALISHTKPLQTAAEQAFWLPPTIMTGGRSDRKLAQLTSYSLKMSLPVLERRRMPKSQLEVMSIDWERSQGWLSVTLLPPSFRRPDPVDPKLLPGTRESWHFSRSTSWSISTISHIPVSSLVTWDCLMWARIMAGLSKNAISSVWLSVSFRFGNLLTLLPVCQRVPFLFLSVSVWECYSSDWWQERCHLFHLLMTIFSGPR